MRLLPREQDRLLLFLAAELARKRRARGLRLNQAEAVALIADEVSEAARDGRSYADAEAAGYAALGAADVADGVAELVRRVEVEALFADGSRLLVLHDPIGSTGPPPQAESRSPGLRGTSRSASSTRAPCRSASRRTSTSSRSTARCASSVPPRGACGSRSRPARRCSSSPAIPREVFLVPFGGARVIRGHGGLADGPLDAEGAREEALALARERGYRGA